MAIIKNYATVSKALRHRLLDAIVLVANETEHAKKNAQPAHAPYLEEAEKSLDKARQHAAESEIDRGWNQVNLARGHLVRCMTPEQINVKADLLRIEASKIPEWRQKQIYHLLGHPDESASRIITTDILIDAMKTRDDFYHTRNHTMALRKASLNVLTITLVVIVLAIIVASFLIDLQKPESFSQELIVAVLFGLLGAGFSMATSASSLQRRLKIPEQLSGLMITVIRITIGGAAALIVLFFYKAGNLSNIFSERMVESGFFYPVISFLSGFSERWVLQLFNSAVKEEGKRE
jgi:hypothetical protein